MSQQLQAFAQAYTAYRLDDQLGYYGRTAREYRMASRRARDLVAALTALAGACGGLAAFGVSAVATGVVATTLGAVATAIAAWADLIGFDENADLYEGAQGQLERLRALRPRSGSPTEADVARYVAQVEGVLLQEVAAWRQKWSGVP